MTTPQDAERDEMDIGFAKDLCDEEGDVFCEGVFIFFDNAIIKFKTVDEFERAIGRLQNCLDEIKATYPEEGA